MKQDNVKKEVDYGMDFGVWIGDVSELFLEIFSVYFKAALELISLPVVLPLLILSSIFNGSSKVAKVPKK